MLENIIIMYFIYQTLYSTFQNQIAEGTEILAKRTQEMIALIIFKQG